MGDPDAAAITEHLCTWKTQKVACDETASGNAHSRGLVRWRLVTELRLPEYVCMIAIHRTMGAS